MPLMKRTVRLPIGGLVVGEEGGGTGEGGGDFVRRAKDAEVRWDKRMGVGEGAGVDGDDLTTAVADRNRERDIDGAGRGLNDLFNIQLCQQIAEGRGYSRRDRFGVGSVAAGDDRKAERKAKHGRSASAGATVEV